LVDAHGQIAGAKAAGSGCPVAQAPITEVRQRGSHKQFRHADGRGTTVPFHKGRDISPVLLRKIARDIGMTVEDL
jgi:hypothetical protein